MKIALRAILLSTVFGIVAATFAVSAASPKTQTVQFSSPDGMVSGFLAVPSTSGKHPALVVLHEWWGLTDWVKGETEKFAEQGYVALAVDLYRGKVTTDPKEAYQLMRVLPQERAVGDLEAAYKFLAARKDVEPGRIGSVGWCMGGTYSLQLAIHEPRLAACVVNYEVLPTDSAELQKIHAPLLGNFGALDREITPDDVHAFEKSMKSYG
ncbi:MAG: dienelactone hydrolase family protein [Candidatus Acidiferrales bacterium]